MDVNTSSFMVKNQSAPSSSLTFLYTDDTDVPGGISKTLMSS